MPAPSRSGHLCLPALAARSGRHWYRLDGAAHLYLGYTVLRTMQGWRGQCRQDKRGNMKTQSIMAIPFVVLILVACAPATYSGTTETVISFQTSTPIPSTFTSATPSSSPTKWMTTEAAASPVEPITTPSLELTPEGAVQVVDPTLTPTLEPIPDDPSALDITYICNDGFIIAAGGKKILIDALFHDSQNVCQADSDETARSARPPFDNADLVLISHGHWDHFDPLIVGNYMLNNPKAILIAEKSAAEALSREFNSFDLVAERVHSVDLARGQKTQLNFAGVNVEIVSSPADVPNLGFLFQLGEFTFFHSGDSGMEPQTISDFRDCQLHEKGINFAFVPYWYLADPMGRSILTKGIRAENYIPMHYAGDYSGKSPAQIFTVVTKYFPQAILFPEEWQSWSP